MGAALLKKAWPQMNGHGSSSLSTMKAWPPLALVKGRRGPSEWVWLVVLVSEGVTVLTLSKGVWPLVAAAVALVN